MNIKLWEPSNKIKKNSNLFKFEKFISERFNKNFNENFKKIHNWSVKNQGDFWSSVWDFSKVKGVKSNTKVKKSKKFFKNTFLPNSRLNFCENLRKYSDIKIFELTNISINETLSRTIITSATTLLALLAIYFFGGEILKGFSLAMILGVVFGTYSSIYIANTVLVRLRVSQKTVLRKDDQNKLN